MTWLSVAHSFHDLGSENEIVQLRIFRSSYFCVGALPPFAALINENDVFSHLDHRIHIVRVDYRGGLELSGDFPYEFVDDDGRLRVET